MQKINTAYLHGKLERYPGGGPALLKDTIWYNLGIRIDHIAMVDFSGFRRIVNVFDGVDIPLACPYTDWHIINSKRSESDPNNWKLYTVGFQADLRSNSRFQETK
jgi:anionic cell wall polymer biosynthesis LytR-Cps2A-Psr (LCP) family protein